jgi:CubicO group peptidase (beta-lactamase class C family)
MDAFRPAPSSRVQPSKPIARNEATLDTSSGLPDTPVGRQVAWLLAFAVDAERDPTEVTRRFDERFLGAVPAEHLLKIIEGLAWTATAEIEDLDATDVELSLTFVVDGKPVRILAARVENASPHRFTSLLFKAPGPTVPEILDSTPPLEGPLDAAVKALFEPLAGSLSKGGIVVGVARGDDREFFSFRADLGARYDIGSITKVFTGLLLAHMVYGGEVSLDDQVNAHLPDGVHLPAGDRDITLLDLATHTSGLPRLPPKMFDGTDESNPYAHIDVTRLYAEIGATEIENHPVGATSMYSNYGMAILGHTLSLVAGRPYADLVLDRICRPLEMNESGFDGTDVVQAYAGGEAVPRWTGEVFEGAGIGMSCSVADLLTFAQAACDPLSTPLAEAFNAALAKRTDVGSPVARSEQGLAWIRIGLLDGSFVYFHNGGTGGFRSTLVAHAPSRTAVVALCNEAEVDSGLDQAAFALIASLVAANRSPG